MILKADDVGIVQGGIAPNVIANEAHFYWDLRTIPMDNINEIVDAYTKYCEEREAELRTRFADFSIKTVENHPIVPHLDTPADSPAVDMVKRLAGNSKLNTVAYAAEAGHFANAGFETVICGPGSIAQAHRADEFIAIDQLHKGVAMLNKLVEELSSQDFE